MKPEFILQADILDIIFENRNKEYGAYNLRRNYESRMKIAMLSVLVLVAGIFVFNFWKQPVDQLNSSGLFIVEDPVIIAPVPIIESPVSVQPPKQKIATVKNVAFILTNDSTTDTHPTIADLQKNVMIGLQTADGAPLISDIAPPEQSKGNQIDKIPVKVATETNEVLLRAEMMPEFPGGQSAFIRFLSKNLRVPENVLEPGQRIRILVRFVVGKDGELSNIQFLQTYGEIFEEEVTRVMKKMPRWKPGIQNGEKVSVYFNLPIIFDSSEE